MRALTLLSTGYLSVLVSFAQAPMMPGAQPAFSPQEVDRLVAPIALYPDPLLAQVLTASTFWEQIPDAAAWARAHSYLTGEALARAITEDNLPWDPSVISLLPFPALLDSMAGNMTDTHELGDAVLTDRTDVMDSIQDLRRNAINYGYLRSNQYYNVVTPAAGDIEILPVNPTEIYIPYYNPNVVFFRSRPGYSLAAAITFGPPRLVTPFVQWGWGNVNFGWKAHTIIINKHPWERNFSNRGTYVHPYQPPIVAHPLGAHTEHHELRQWQPGPQPAQGRVQPQSKQNR